MHFFHLCLIFLLIKSCQNRSLWEPEITKLSIKALENDKPIQLNNTDAQLEIVGIQDTVYAKSFSQLYKVMELRLTHSEIRKIESGALCSAPDLTILELDLSMNHDPPLLTKNMFENCEKLRELFLKFDYNNPSKIEEDALGNLINLEVFGVDSLEVNNLRKNFLKLSPKSLKRLLLSNLHLKNIDPSVFEDFTNLEDLEIVHNLELTQLPLNLFKNSQNLRRLVLRDNKLNVTWDEFDGLSSLEELDVVDNKISYFDTSKIVKNMPNLKKFFMEVNLPCSTQETVRTQLKEMFKHAIEFPETFSICEK